jgi:hypothetical protein
MVGLRHVAALKKDRLTASVGAGFALAYYQETASAGPNTDVACISCASQTHGSGPFGLLELDWLVGSARQVGIGLATRLVRLAMDDYFGSDVPVSTADLGIPGPRDQWLQITAKVTRHF